MTLSQNSKAPPPMGVVPSIYSLTAEPVGWGCGPTLITVAGAGHPQLPVEAESRLRRLSTRHSGEPYGPNLRRQMIPGVDFIHERE